MLFQVYNGNLSVDTLDIQSVSSSSLVLVGDTEMIQLVSLFDTPPESLIIGPFVPLSPED